MARWGVAFNSGGSSVKTVGLLVAAAASPRRAKIVDWKFGSSQSPADNEFVHIIQQCTTAGTGAAKTPYASDQADTLASTIVAKDTITADPTLTAADFYANIAVNQRASFRWVPAPFMELIIPATSSQGFAFAVSAATTTTFAEDVLYEEL
jgi:hypothetical protein